jgi:hypothetical protein
MRIAVVSMTVGAAYREITKYGVRTKAEYCSAKGYDFYNFGDEVHDPSRPAAWSKIPAIQRIFLDASYDIVVWIDADTYIINHDLRIEDVINEHLGGEEEILVVRDQRTFNTGVIFMRNTPRVHRFWEKVWSQEEFIHAHDWEQSSFIHLVETEWDKGLVKALGMEYQYLLNSYWYQFSYERTFILHLGGCYREEDKATGTSLLDMVMRRYCPIKRDDETVETWQERVATLKNHWGAR